MTPHSSQHEPGSAAGAFGIEETADLLGVSPARLRGWIRAGLAKPTRGPRREHRFTFRDLAFLRGVRDLGDARIPPRRVRSALEHLRDHLPEDRDLTTVRLGAAAGQVVVRDGEALWSPESGQFVFDFERRAGPAVVAFAPRARATTRPLSAEDWYAVGCDLEETDRDRAREAYLLSVQIDPTFADAHVNLGCLHHADGKLEDAEAHYRAALDARPGDATARFDLAVVLDDQGREADAREAYEAALAADPACAEAHFNLARLCERAGDTAGVVRHLTACRRLERGD